MHDEPTIDFMNYVGLDTIGVGNHEFDEGKAELLRMQYGNRDVRGRRRQHRLGLRPGPRRRLSSGRRLPGRHAVLRLRLPVPRRERDRHGVRTTRCCRVPDRDQLEGEKIAFIGETLQGTPLIVTPTGVAGLSFLDEADTVNALVSRLKQRKVSTIVLLLHEGGIQNAPFSRGFRTSNKCENFTGPDLLDIVNRLDPAVDVVVSAHTHQPYICNFNNRLVTSASSFGRLITSIDITIDRTSNAMVSATANNNVVTQTVAKDAGATEILDPVQGDRRSDRQPCDREGHGGHPLGARHPERAPNRAGEQPMGDVIADADVRGDEGRGLRRRRGRVHERRRRPRRAWSTTRSAAGSSRARSRTREAFAVQPFGNTLVVKTCTGQQLYDVLEQQFDNPSVGSDRVMAVRRLTYTYTRGNAAGSTCDAGLAHDRRRRRRSRPRPTGSC